MPFPQFIVEALILYVPGEKAPQNTVVLLGTIQLATSTWVTGFLTDTVMLPPVFSLLMYKNGGGQLLMTSGNDLT